MPLSSLCQQKAIRNHQNFLAKDLKDQCIGINIKQKVKTKIRHEYRYFLESNFERVNRFFVLIYSNQGDNAKRFKVRSYYLPKGIIKIITPSSMEKNFYD